MVLQRTSPKLYPDVLGMLVEDRVTVDEAVQCSFGIFPTMTAIDQPVEALLLLQNLFDQPLVLNINVYTPQRDAAGNLLNIFTPKPRLSVTLPAAECGMVHLPIIAQHPTPPGKGYPVTVQITVAQKPDRARQICPLTGGTKPNLLTMSPFRLATLRDINFAACVTGNNRLETRFDVLFGQFPPRPDAPKPRYELFWTMNDLEQEQDQLQAVGGEALRFARSLSRPQLYTPLLNLTRDIFGDAGIPLHPGEASYIAKLLTYVASDGLDLEMDFSVAESAWFEHLCQLMVQDLNIVQNTDHVLDLLYTSIIKDAVKLGFSMLSHETKADLGDETEQAAYTSKIIDALEGRLTLGLEHVYVPLVIAGTLLSGRVIIAGENPWRLLNMLKEARDGRISLAGIELREVFDILNQMIAKAERALKELRIPRD